jgi:hypothetical protein
MNAYMLVILTRSDSPKEGFGYREPDIRGERPENSDADDPKSW